jgi:hypothetical protein
MKRMSCSDMPALLKWQFFLPEKEKWYKFEGDSLSRGLGTRNDTKLLGRLGRGGGLAVQAAASPPTL